MICKHFVKVLFPFQYTKEADCRLENITITNAKGKEKPLFERFGFDGVELRKGVQELFSEKDNTARIVDCYSLAYDARTFMNLPRRKEEPLQFSTRDHKGEDPYAVSIREVSLYLFESEVGFFELECGFESSEIADYIQCNYFLSEIKSKNNIFRSVNKVWNGTENQEEVKEFTVKVFLQSLLDKIPGLTVKDFYTGEEWSETHEKGIVYSYLYLEEKPNNFETLVYNIRNNYKESYKVPQQSQSIKSDPGVRQQFENSYWVTSYNGTINISHKTEDEITNQFFENDFYGKMHHVYYVLFLSVIHQRFLLLKAMTEMVEISNLNLDCEETKKQLIRINNYRLKISKLKCRAFYEKPSYVQHVNNYYELMTSAYSIKDLHSGLMSRMGDIEQVCKVYVAKIKTHDDQVSKIRSNRIEAFVSVFGTLVGLVTVTNEAWGLIEKISKSMEKTFSIPLLIAMIAVWLPSSILVYNNASKKLKEAKELKDDMEREEAVSGKIEDTN